MLAANPVVSLRLSNGQKLLSPPGLLARPTLALVREAVLNRFSPQLAGCRWLDLCSGSGVMACEALLHGANFVQLVEANQRVAAIARSNLLSLGNQYRNKWNLAVAEVGRWVSRNRNSAMEPFSFIYADPPYNANLYGAISDGIQTGGWISPEGILLIECSRDEAPNCNHPWLEQDRRRYGRTMVLQWRALPTQSTAAAILIPSGNEQTQ